MCELKKRISLSSILSVLSIVEPEPDLWTGSAQKVPALTGSGSATLPTGTKYYDERRGVWLMVWLVNVQLMTLCLDKNSASPVLFSSFLIFLGRGRHFQWTLERTSDTKQ